MATAKIKSLFGITYDKEILSQKMFLSFCQKCVLAIFRLFDSQKRFEFFYKTGFLLLLLFFKRAFRMLKALLRSSNAHPKGPKTSPFLV
jgi:hypothetical protein